MAVHAEIEFLAPGTERRPFTYARETPPGAEPANVRFAAHAVEIQDVREHAPLRFDAHGVTLGRWPTQVRCFDEDAQVRHRYYPESVAIIKGILGADRVIVFDHNVRRGGVTDPRTDGHDIGRPVHHAHTDYTPHSALQRLRRELGVHAEEGVSRYLQVNLWRPTREPVRDAPLALCDGASLSEHALRAVELRYAERRGEI